MSMLSRIRIERDGLLAESDCRSFVARAGRRALDYLPALQKS